MTQRFVIYPEQELTFLAVPSLERSKPPVYMLSPLQIHKTCYDYNALGSRFNLSHITDSGIEKLVENMYNQEGELVTTAVKEGLPVVLSSGVYRTTSYELTTGKYLSSAPNGTIIEPIDILISVLYFPTPTKQPYDPARAVIEVVGITVEDIPKDKQRVRVALIGNRYLNLNANIRDYFTQAKFVGGVKNLETAKPVPLKPFTGEVFIWGESEFNLSQEEIAKYNGKVKFRQRFTKKEAVVEPVD